MARHRPDIIDASLDGLLSFLVWFGCVCVGATAFAVVVTLALLVWRGWLWLMA